MTNITKKDLPFLLEDISDYLMERATNIGTNFLEEFPNTYSSGNKLYIVDKNGKQQAVLTISIGDNKDK